MPYTDQLSYHLLASKHTNLGTRLILFFGRLLLPGAGGACQGLKPQTSCAHIILNRANKLWLPLTSFF